MKVATATTELERIDTCGFVHIPSFLSAEEIETLLADYQTNIETGERRGNFLFVSPDAEKSIAAKLQAIAEGVRNTTGVTVDATAIHVGLYISSESTNLDWHQDHESYYAVQNHYDYLNFFIPLVKPDPSKSNLRVIPLDTLKGRAPVLYEKIARRGATNYQVVNHKTLVRADDGLLGVLPFDLNEIAQTPELAAGDLLLLRGDVIHRTQDVETKRLAVSIRLTNPDTLIRKRTLLTGGLRKTRTMARYWHIYGPVLRALDQSEAGALTWRQLSAEVERWKGENGPEQLSGRRVLALLIGRKITGGELLSSLRIVCWSLFGRIFADIIRSRR